MAWLMLLENFHGVWFLGSWKLLLKWLAHAKCTLNICSVNDSLVWRFLVLNTLLVRVACSCPLQHFRQPLSLWTEGPGEGERRLWRTWVSGTTVERHQETRIEEIVSVTQINVDCFLSGPYILRNWQICLRNMGIQTGFLFLEERNVKKRYIWNDFTELRIRFWLKVGFYMLANWT